MKSNRSSKRWICSALIGLGLTGAILNVQAQATADLNINTFETANTVVQGQNPQFPQFAAENGGTVYNTVAWDSSTETYGGSCKVTVDFSKAWYGQVLNVWGCMGGTPYLMNLGPVSTNWIVFTNYASVDFDVMWDTNNSTISVDYFNNPPSGSSMFLRAIKTNAVAGTKEFFTLTSNFTFPSAASNGWVHVSVPITASSNALCKGIYFIKTGITGQTFTNGGIANFWIDNVTLKAPTNRAVAILDSDNFQSYPLGQDLTTGGYRWSVYMNNNTNVVWGNPTITYTPATNQYAATVVDSSALPTQGTYWSGTIYSGVRQMPAGISTNLANIQLNLNVVEIGNYTHQTAPVKLELQSIAADGTSVTGESDLTVPVWYQWMNTVGGVLTNFTATTNNGAATPFDPTAPKYRYCLYVDQGWEFLLENNNVIKIGKMVLSNPNAQIAGPSPNFTAGGISILPGGTVSLTATGALGVAYSLWAGTNLVATPITNTWTKLTNSTISVSPFTIQLPGAAGQHFYIFSSP